MIWDKIEPKVKPMLGSKALPTKLLNIYIYILCVPHNQLEDILEEYTPEPVGAETIPPPHEEPTPDAPVE